MHGIIRRRPLEWLLWPGLTSAVSKPASGTAPCTHSSRVSDEVDTCVLNSTTTNRSLVELELRTHTCVLNSTTTTQSTRIVDWSNLTQTNLHLGRGIINHCHMHTVLGFASLYPVGPRPFQTRICIAVPGGRKPTSLSLLAALPTGPCRRCLIHWL